MEEKLVPENVQMNLRKITIEKQEIAKFATLNFTLKKIIKKKSAQMIVEKFGLT